MIYFGDFWKIVFLVAFIVFAPPILWGVDKAHGQLQPPNAAIGEYVTAGEASGIRGVLTDGDGGVLPGDLILSGQFVGMYQGMAVFNGWRVVNGNVTPLQIIPQQTEYVYFGIKESYLGGTGSFLPEKINGENLIIRMLRTGKMWDINGDGVVDWRDVKLFLDDMDQDGIPNAVDYDADGDGENNYAESAEPETATSDTYKKYDPSRFPDRDGDSLPDLLDKDNDGYANWLEQRAGTNPNDASNKPADDWNLEFVDSSGTPVQTNVLPGGAWNDSDGDGPWDWLETLMGTNPADPNSWHDGDGDGHWDWKYPNGQSMLVSAPVVEPPDPPDPPEEPVPDPPYVSPTPVLVGGTTGAGGTGGGGSGTTVTNPVDSSGNPGAGSQAPPGETGENPENVDSGGTAYVHVHPKGTSSAYMGVGGGTWQQSSSPNHGALMNTAANQMTSTTDRLINALKGVEVGGQVAHVVTLPVKWVDGSTKSFSIPLLPDPSTEWGAIAETVRVFLRAFAVMFVSWVLFRSVWTALRQL